MYNSQKMRKVVIVVVWILVITLILSTLSLVVFAETENGSTGNIQVQMDSKTLAANAKAASTDLTFMAELMDFIQENYVEEISTEELLNAAYQGLFDGLDPYSIYFASEEESNTFIQIATGTDQKTGETLSSVDAVMLTETIGYLSISHFYETTDVELEEKWLSLKAENPKMDGLVVDVRNNPGGLTDVSMLAAELFLDKGSIVMHYMQKGEIIVTYETDRDKVIDIPTVVLTNEFSASAAEVFVSAVKENQAATIVGVNTYGKGAAQMIYNLPNGAAMKLTTLYFLSPQENQIDGIGIAPDYVVRNEGRRSFETKMSELGVLAPMSEKRKYLSGETGLNVYAAQQRLILLGENDLPITATLDEKTYKAIKKFQAASDLYAYGGLDFATMNALEQAMTEKMEGLDQDNQLNYAITLLT